MGTIGVVRNGKILIYEISTKLHTTKSEFDVSNLTSLHKFSIVYVAEYAKF